MLIKGTPAHQLNVTFLSLIITDICLVRIGRTDDSKQYIQNMIKIWIKFRAQNKIPVAFSHRTWDFYAAALVVLLVDICKPGDTNTQTHTQTHRHTPTHTDTFIATAIAIVIAAVMSNILEVCVERKLDFSMDNWHRICLQNWVFYWYVCFHFGRK